MRHERFANMRSVARGSIGICQWIEPGFEQKGMWEDNALAQLSIGES
jgi:hypothetical protein